MVKQTESPTLPRVPKTPQMREIEQKHGGKDIRLIMKEIYELQGTQSAIAKEFGVEQSTIFFWALRLGMTFRAVAEINGMAGDGRRAEKPDTGGGVRAAGNIGA